MPGIAQTWTGSIVRTFFNGDREGIPCFCIGYCLRTLPWSKVLLFVSLEEAGRRQIQTLWDQVNPRVFMGTGSPSLFSSLDSAV
jgi:hypothetical protein